jgi:hypothetical protein
MEEKKYREVYKEGLPKKKASKAKKHLPQGRAYSQPS